MNTYKMKNRDLTALRKFCAANGYGRGWRKRVIIRATLNDGYDFYHDPNIRFFEANGIPHDYGDWIGMSYIVGEKIRIPGDGTVKLDIFVYDKYGDLHDCLQPVAKLIDGKLVWELNV